MCQRINILNDTLCYVTKYGSLHFDPLQVIYSVERQFNYLPVDINITYVPYILHILEYNRSKLDNM